MRIAVIGSGISGNVAARLLSSRHDVTLYEAASRPGGHANTVDVNAFGRSFSVDTAFMVFNRRTYPNFCRLLEWLEIPSQASDMSFSVRCERSGLEYCGTSLNTLFAQRSNLVRPSFWKMLLDIGRFNRAGTFAAANGGLSDGCTVGEFLQECGVGRAFIEQYLVPMAAAIWSADPSTIMHFPAKFMIGFYANHGLMQVRNHPQWRTITGGSRNYVNALLEPLADRVRLNCPIAAVTRRSNEVLVEPCGQPVESYDEAVFATHADQTLRILSNPTQQERDVLRSFPYQPNEAVLHTDASLLPTCKRAWASWNYHIPAREEANVSVTYDLSRLQNLDTPSPILLTLNATDRIAPETVLQRFTYHHPAYSRQSIAAQSRHAEISGHNRTHYCGAYWGNGFHEDGVNSALAVACRFGIDLETCTAASTKEQLHIAAMSH